MKGLLHSKTFRTNLKKWLFMYVGTLCIFTSVVTYSKYVSSFKSDDEGEVARFNIKVEYLNECSNTNNDASCVLPATRPLENYDFYFKVDTSEIDVKSFVVITTQINPKYTNYFEIKEIVEVDKNLKSILERLDKIEYTVMPTDIEQVKYYKVSISHNIQATDSAWVDDNALIIGYSAKQVY